MLRKCYSKTVPSCLTIIHLFLKSLLLFYFVSVDPLLLVNLNWSHVHMLQTVYYNKQRQIMFSTSYRYLHCEYFYFF